MIALRPTILVLLAIMAACGFDSGFVGPCDTDGGSSSGSTSSSSGDEDDGTDSSTSSNGGSASGTTGVPESTSGGTGDESSSSSGTTSAEEETGSSSGDASCLSNSDCDGSEVCAAEQCVDAWSVPHAVRVLEWDEPCDGAGTNVFFARYNGADTQASGCPQQWPNDWWTVVGGSSFAVDFFEAGSAPNPDQHVTSWCWDSGLGCGPIPKDVLHEGGAVVSWDDWTAEFDFEVVQ